MDHSYNKIIIAQHGPFLPPPKPPKNAGPRYTPVTLLKAIGEHLEVITLKCYNWCKFMGLFPPTRSCTQCQREMILHLDKGLWVCKCSKKLSIKTGTIFANSNLTPGQILLLINCYVRKMTYRSVQDYVIIDNKSICKDTITRWFKRFGMMLVAEMRNSPQIGGPGIIVQIDEAAFLRRKFEKGRKKGPPIWIFGAIDSFGRCRLTRCPGNKRTQKQLLPIIQAQIHPESIIHSDEWPAYRCLSKNGFLHDTVCHEYNYKNPFTGTHTNAIEGLWQKLRRLTGLGGRRKKDIDRVLAIFAWRYNCDMRKIDPFFEFLKHCKYQQ